MKHSKLRHILALALCLSLCLFLLALPAAAADEIWTVDPTGWSNWGHVHYEKETVNYMSIPKNWGVRGEPCNFLSKYAQEYYVTSEDQSSPTDRYFYMTDLAGGTGTGDAPGSPLYTALNQFLTQNHVHKTSYNETRDYYRLTDCMANNSNYISSFYSGRKLNGAWDSGTTWNREHTWPNSKCSGDMENDIMMLRPTSVQENSDRGNKAYGESSGYYNPNTEADGRFDLRGDCARICLYCYVRYPESVANMWGQSGVMESLDLLLNWMEADPVDTWEMGRNDTVSTITGLRNVFVDFPELAWALFGREVPESYSTPFKGEHNQFVSAPPYLEARPDDPTHGSVSVEGWAVNCSPSEGYYASGFSLYDISGEQPIDFSEWTDFRWEYGRLLYFPTTEADYLVEIHFTPIGETDPCPTGHDLNEEQVEILEAPSCTASGLGVESCKRCGKSVSVVLPQLPHDWDNGTIIVPATTQENGTIRYTCRRCGESYTTEYSFRFMDVAAGKYYHDAVIWAVNHDPQITKGTDASHFSPDRTCTRAEVVTFLWRAMGCPEPAGSSAFTDVKAGSYYAKAASWAAEQGITQGTGGGRFSPDVACTRAQVVTFLWRAAETPAPNQSDTGFSDVKSGSYYEAAVAWAVEEGITKGTGEGCFSPNQSCTRGQIVTFLWRFITE